MESRRRRSPAIIVGILGLVAALAGTAIAGSGATTSAVSVKKVKKLITAEVAKQVANARGPAGTPGATGAPGANGTDGTARAYTEVVPHAHQPCTGGPGGFECTLVTSKGIARVSHFGTGQYCVTAPGISSSQVPAVVSVITAVFSPTPDGNASAMVAGGCNDGTAGGFFVHTERQPVTTVCTNDSCTATANVTGSAVDADDVRFTIVIP